MFATELNFRIHVALAIIVVLSGIFFEVTALQWLALVLSIGLVLVAEALNTALEYLADALHPEHDPKIALAKNAAAAGVLIAAVAAAVVGAIVFLPELWEWYRTIEAK